MTSGVFFSWMDHGLQEAIAGHTDSLAADPEAHPGWQEIQKQLSQPCFRLFQLLKVDASPGNSTSAGDCERQLVPTM